MVLLGHATIAAARRRGRPPPGASCPGGDCRCEENRPPRKRQNGRQMPAGRPPKVTSQLVAWAAELRRDGFPVAAIAERLDVSKRTTQRALARARRKVSDVRTLFSRGALPLATESTLVSSIARAAEGDWRAAAWLLERMAPERCDRAYRPTVPAPSAAFAEVDELARRRRTTTATASRRSRAARSRPRSRPRTLRPSRGRAGRPLP